MLRSTSFCIFVCLLFVFDRYSSVQSLSETFHVEVRTEDLVVGSRANIFKPFQSLRSFENTVFIPFPQLSAWYGVDKRDARTVTSH